MSHISTIGAGIFSDLSVYTGTTTDFSALDSASEFAALFGTLIADGGTQAAGTFQRIENVREFPSMGTPPNIVNVPVYGQKTSKQVQGQSDAPNMEVTINYVPADWADGTDLGDLIKTNKETVFRFALMNSEPAGFISTNGASGLGSVENSVYYWVGKLEALQVNPQLTDANTATLTISVQSKFFGAYTVSATA